MKIKLYILLSLFSVIFIFQNCDIQKKRYSRGYTINRTKHYNNKTKIHDNKKNSVSTNLTKDQDTLSIIKPNTTTQIPSEDSFTEEIEDSNKSESKQIKDFTHNKTNFNQQKNFSIAKNKTQKINDNRNSEINAFSVMSLIFVILSLLAIIISLNFLLILLGFLITYILGFAAKIQMKKNRSRYTFSSDIMATTALVLMYLSFTVSLIVLFIVLIGPLFIAAAGTGYFYMLIFLISILLLILALFLVIGPLILRGTKSNS